jgi:hypothetical protein
MITLIDFFVSLVGITRELSLFFKLKIIVQYRGGTRVEKEPGYSPTRF